MQPDEPAGLRERAGESFEPNARRVRRDQRGGRQARLEVGEQRPFRLGLLDDRFDDEIRGAGLCRREVDAQTPCRGFGLPGRAQAFAKQLARTRQRGFDVLLGAIL